MKRLTLACRFGVVLGLLMGSASALRAEEPTVLPVGSAPAPVSVSHFPDRLHAVVWRNWRLVPTERLATVLHATPEQLTAVAASMGLPPAGDVDPALARRLYITVLRRNWHLLPYEQILPLVEMSAEELAFALREDDFLFIKLGNLKPHCEPVRYTEPNEAARAQAAWIRGVVEREFGPAIAAPEQPRLAFVEELSTLPEGSTPAPARDLNEPPRFLYSYFGSFGDPLADGAGDAYPEGLLARLRQSGANGVWLHVVLRQLAPGGEAFPEFGEGHERRLANLRKLVERAKRHGMDVYLYMNEPRAMPEAFFASRPEKAGALQGDHRALCTSDPAVRGWMADALAFVFREVPDLGGVFTITASENFTHCASHRHPETCPRCKERSRADVIAEVNATIAEGVHRSAPNAKVIVWDWGWPDNQAPDIIAKLPDDVWFQSVSEWSLPIERGGVSTVVGEYSLSAVGPGPRATKHWALARSRGLKTSAKVQLNITWELSAVPWLPVLDLVAEHTANLTRADVSGMQLSWSLGGYPSPNLLVAQRIGEGQSAEAALDSVAAERYGKEAAPAVRRAWSAFSQAFREYPYGGSVLYNAPQQYGPSNLLFASPTGYRSTMCGFPYDDLDHWRGPYPPEVFARQFERVAEGWAEGLTILKGVSGPLAEADARLAEAAGCHLQSVADQARFVMARDAGNTTAMNTILDREATTARRLFDLTRLDARIGFEASNHDYYVPLDLAEKVVNCRHLQQSLPPVAASPTR